MPRLLEEVYRLRRDPTGIDSEEQRLVKMFANLLESHHDVPEPRNRLTFGRFDKNCRNTLGVVGEALLFNAQLERRALQRG